MNPHILTTDNSTRAWVVLVMIRDEYATGAAVVAQSLRQVGTKYPIWCAYSEISDGAVAILSTIFDKMVPVPIIEHPCVPMKTAKQETIYRSWIEKSFTKWNIMNPDLFPLERVVLLDADVEVMLPIDDIFDLPAPAATFSSPWVAPYVRVIGVDDLSKDGTLTSNPFCDIVDGAPVELAHAATVEPWRIEVGLIDAIGPVANMVLLAPSTESYSMMLKLLRADRKFGRSTCMGGFDEQLLARVWLDMGEPITNIHQEYNWTVGKETWLQPGMTPRTHQFYNGKPWREIASEADRKNIRWPDVVSWWVVADSIIAHNPAWKAWFYRGWVGPNCGTASDRNWRTQRGKPRAPARRKW